jgi:DNA primase
VKLVAELGHVDISEYHLETPKHEVNEQFKVYYDMHEEANKLYSYYLHTAAGNLARDYLKDRGFSEEIIKTFDVGYAPIQNILYTAFTRLGYKEIDMVKSGLVVESNKHYDRFNDRIMFPLHDEYGRIVGFSGRIYKNGQDGAKYMNSPESDIFIKGQVLYNYHRAKEYVKKEGFVYMNEGFMDVIAMKKAGHGNALALMGTALTQGHIRMLKKLTHKVVICLDGDEAGQNAAYKASQFLTENDFEVKIVLLPDGRDPDEIYTSEGKDGLDAALKDQLSPLDFLLIYQSGRLDLANYDDRRKLLDVGVKAIAPISDRVDREHYVEKLSKLTDFSVSIIHEQLNDVTESITPEIDYSAEIHRHLEDAMEISSKYDVAERNLLFYMLKDKSVADTYEKKLGFMYNDQYRVLASYITDYYLRHPKMKVANLVNTIGPDHQELTSTLMSIDSMTNLPEEIDPKVIDDYIKIISENAMRMKKDQLLEQFHYVLDPHQKSAILQEIIELRKKKETL